MAHLETSQAPQLYEALIEQSPDATIFADPAGKIQVWNPSAEAIFGYSRQEAIGQSLDIIIPENLRKPHWAGFESAMKMGHTAHGRQVITTRATHKNGSKIYVNLSFGIVCDAQGKAVGAMAQARDFTARYMEEKALRKRIAELEAGSARK